MFPSTSSLITSSWDKSVRFWQVGTPSVDPLVGQPKSTPPASPPIKSITLHTKDGVFVSIDSAGIVKIWDISTGHCKTSLQTPAKDADWVDVRLVNGRPILVWYTKGQIPIWDMENQKPIRAITLTRGIVYNIRLSEDGSKVFCLKDRELWVWFTRTGEFVGKIVVEMVYIQTSLVVNGTRVWVYSPYSPTCNEWDLGIPGSSSSQLPQTTLLHLSHTKLWDIGSSRIEDTATGKLVLQLGGRFAKPVDVQLDGQYFLARYQSGEVLILGFNHVIPW